MKLMSANKESVHFRIHDFEETVCRPDSQLQIPHFMLSGRTFPKDCFKNVNTKEFTDPSDLFELMNQDLCRMS